MAEKREAKAGKANEKNKYHSFPVSKIKLVHGIWHGIAIEYKGEKIRISSCFTPLPSW